MYTQHINFFHYFQTIYVDVSKNATTNSDSKDNNATK